MPNNDQTQYTDLQRTVLFYLSSFEKDAGKGRGSVELIDALEDFFEKNGSLYSLGFKSEEADSISERMSLAVVNCLRFALVDAATACCDLIDSMYEVSSGSEHDKLVADFNNAEEHLRRVAIRKGFVPDHITKLEVESAEMAVLGRVAVVTYVGEENKVLKHLIVLDAVPDNLETVPNANSTKNEKNSERPQSTTKKKKPVKTPKPS